VPDADDLRSLTFRDYVRVVWVRLWLAVAVAVVCTGAAYLVANHQVRMYQAGALLMYQPPPNVSNLGSSSVDTNTLNIQLQNVINAIDGPALGARARALLSAQDARLKAKVTAALYTSKNAGANVYPNQIEVTAETVSAAASARIANAYANSVIALRKQDQQAGYRAALNVLQDQEKLFTTAQSKLSADYVNLVTLILNLQVAEATATGDFSVSVPAVKPPSPASPRPLKSAAIGFGVGLVAGIGLAFAVGKFDTRVRTQRDATELLGLPSMARLPRIGRQALRQDGLVTMSEPDGTFSEALRMLRSNLEWSNIDDNLRTVLVTSSIKGEGKTLTTCNLAVTLARAGKNVVVVDADLRDPRVHKVFKLPNSAGLTSVVRGTVALDRAFQVFAFSPSTHAHLAKPAKLSLKTAPGADAQSPGDASEGEVFVLTSGPVPPDPGEVVASRKLAAALLEIGQSNADYVLIDAPPLLSVGDAASLSSSVDGLLMVANLGMLRRPTLTRVRELLDSLPCRKLGVVFVGEKVEHPEYYHYKTRARSTA
jgi:Mrp family chromosome partitioning ATPase/capsular polysaccharide biosynthesis protein